MHLLEPVFSASFLNDQGDIIAALNKKLVVIRADSYQFLTADEMANLLIDYAKSQLQQQPGQPLSQAALNAQRAAAQLAASGSKVHQALVRQATMAQVITDIKLHLSYLPNLIVCMCRLCACCTAALALLQGTSIATLGGNCIPIPSLGWTSLLSNSAPASNHKQTIVVPDRLTDTTKPRSVQSSKHHSPISNAVCMHLVCSCSGAHHSASRWPLHSAEHGP